MTQLGEKKKKPKDEKTHFWGTLPIMHPGVQDNSDGRRPPESLKSYLIK